MHRPIDWKRLAPLALLIPATACTQTAPLAPPSTLAAGQEEYRLGPGDKLHISVYREDQLTGDYIVGETGAVAFPLIEPIPAKGLTLDEFRAALVGALRKGYLTDPRVTVDVVSYRPYYILGEVERPGRYPTTDGITLVRAVATAGGFTYRAQKRYVFLRREGETAEVRVPLDTDIKLRPGDVIRIGERYF